jgi:hypothetical protein
MAEEQHLKVDKPIHITTSNERHFVDEALTDININNNTSASKFSAERMFVGIHTLMSYRNQKSSGRRDPRGSHEG